MQIFFLALKTVLAPDNKFSLLLTCFQACTKIYQKLILGRLRRFGVLLGISSNVPDKENTWVGTRNSFWLNFLRLTKKSF